jgi:hypothetical protein
MDQTRRYLFTGNASGLAFHIRRPVDAVLPVQGASSLPITGGFHESKIGKGMLPKPGSADNYVTFESVSTSANADYTDAKLAVASTRYEVGFDEVPTLTTVTSEVTGLMVLGRVYIESATMNMQARNAVYPGEPSIMCEGTSIGKVAVDGYPLRVTLNEDFFCDNDTFTKLAQAAADGVAPQLFFPANRAAYYGYPNRSGMAKCTLVSEMAWESDPHPDATIEGNCITVPNFGKVFFSELYVTDCARRMTMFRFQLGSDDGGEGSGGGGDVNGGPWPPLP